MNLVIGSSAWYVAGARFVDGDSIVSVQLVNVVACLEYEDGSKKHVIDFTDTRLAGDDKLFVDHEEALAAAIAFQKLKIKNARELLGLHTGWLERLENP